MRTFLRQLSVPTRRPGRFWLTLLLQIYLFVPSACLIWFMHEAARNERLAARQQLMDLYRANLALAQGRFDAWRMQSVHDTETNTLAAPALFAALVRNGIADSAVCFDANGKPAYPAPGISAHADSAALAFQGKARDLNESGKKKDAADLIIDAAAHGRFQTATDEQGRLILPSLELMALEAINSATLLERLQTELNDYSNTMPSGQRRFLMHRLTSLFPKQTAFSTLVAEDFAAALQDAGSQIRDDSQLTATSLPGWWQLSAAHGRVLLLFRPETLQAHLREAATQTALPADASVALVAPGATSGNDLLAMPAGENFPGWQLALTLKNGDVFNAAAREKTVFYAWAGVLTVTLVTVLTVLGAGMIRRQAAVAQLRNDLLANVTHELKTPLSSMRLLVDTLLQSQPLHEETARQYLQLIAAENLRLSRLIDNFLAFSRLERNKHAFEFATVPAASLVESAAAAVRERFAGGGCHFAVQANPGLPRVNADADAMVTVLLNLLDNAWKYSGENKQITLSAGPENGSVAFAVKDNGIGLSPRDTKRIFQRFYQVDQRLARTGGGCGLGLSIVQYIVNAHHGKIRVQSEPNRGSTFIVTLPVAAEASS